MQQLAPYEEVMTEEMGGRVGEVVRQLKQKGAIHCHGICRKDTPTDDIRGYPHDGGIPDKDGKRWWVYVHCANPVKRCGKTEECAYDTSWGKAACGVEEANG